MHQLEINYYRCKPVGDNSLRDLTVATKIDSEELKRIDKIIRRRGLLNRSDLVREAIKLYLSVSSLETETRLKILRLIDESAESSRMTAAQLVEKAREEEEFKPRPRLSDIRGSRTLNKQDWLTIRKSIRESEAVTQKKLGKMYNHRDLAL